MLCLFVYSILGLGMRYLLRFNLFLMTELLNENQAELLWVTDYCPIFSLISPSNGRISSSLNKGAACSLPFLIE